VAARRLLPGGGPATWCEHDRLVVDGAEVDWWVDEAGVHACTLDGLARALAWQAGAWPLRFAVAAALADPAAVDELLLDQAFTDKAFTDKAFT